MAAKNRFHYLLEYGFARALFGGLGALPESLGRPVGRALGRLVGGLVASRSRRAAESMRSAFPAAEPSQVLRWVRECWENLGESLWEFSRIPGMTSEQYFSAVDVEGMEHLRKSQSLGKGIIMVTAHYTNWEYITPLFPFSDIKLSVIARRMKNPYVNDFINRVRGEHGSQVFLHKNAVRESIRWLKQGNTIGMLVDQRITDGGKQIPFFNRPAYTTTLPAILALRLGAALHPVRCLREGKKLRVQVYPAMDAAGLSANEKDVLELSTRLNGLIESWVRERPPMWLWIHDRWK